MPEGTPDCSSFNFSPYADENAATEPLLKHHEQQLKSLGVKFDVQGGFKMYDVHSLTGDALTIGAGPKTFRGIFDGCVAPFGLMPHASLMHCRIVYEHKTPQVFGIFAASFDACNLT